MQATISNPVLQNGARGPKVKELQQLLNSKASGDYLVAVDGVFGAKTEALVKTFQTIYFLTVDGIVGPKSWRAFYAGMPVDTPILSFGSKGDLVKQLQQVLSIIDSQLKLVPDGIWGSKTEAAVKQYQQSHQTEVDRNGKVIVGPKTWKALSQFQAGYRFSM